MKKFFLMGLMSAALISLSACGDNPEALGNEFGEATYKCESKKDAAACDKQKNLEKKIQGLSDEDKLVAAQAALKKGFDMAAEDLKNVK